MNGSNRDIAVGTRTILPPPPAGRVFVRQLPNFDWVDQTVAPSNVVALKFSPSYFADFSLVVVASDNAGTYLHLGLRDIGNNSTSWDTVAGYPVLVRDLSLPPSSPTASQIITADLELPSDFSGQVATLRRCYVSTDVDLTPPAPNMECIVSTTL